MSVRVYLSSMHALFWVYVLLTMDHPGNPFANLGAWLDLRARRKSLRLLNHLAWFAWNHGEDP